MHFSDYLIQSIDLVHLPKAHGEAVFAGAYRTEISDFVVTEDLGFEPAGTGPHLWSLIRKRGISTEEATSRLAQISKTSRKDLGYAGKKDTHAVATQWISLPETAVIEEGVIDKSLEVLRLTRNQRKLKIGQLAGNRFEIRLHGSAVGDLEERIQWIATEGVPNYFGPQRFGRSGSNLEAARRLARRDPTGRGRLHPKDGMAGSAARSAGSDIEKLGWKSCKRSSSVSSTISTWAARYGSTGYRPASLPAKRFIAFDWQISWPLICSRGSCRNDGKPVSLDWSRTIFLYPFSTFSNFVDSLLS